MIKMKLPPNTRIHKNGHIEFRKQYKGKSIVRTWTIIEKEKAYREIYDLLLKMSKNDSLILETEHRMLIEEACDIYLQIHGKDIKEGKAYVNFVSRLNLIRQAWTGRYFDSITKYDVRDFLSKFKNTCTVMRYMATLVHLFNSFVVWNEEGNILKVKVKAPSFNPGTKWKKEMRSAQKKQFPRTRVLSPGEWATFKSHLSDSPRAICEIALRRFLRMSDIKQISRMMIKGDLIEGLQIKTGEPFKVPVLDNQPVNYDFTNFRREFKNAQVAAQMDYPNSHPLHFTVRDLRRTGATWAYKKTKDLVGISKMLGHTSIVTTIRYLGIDETDRKSIADAVDGLANLGIDPKLGNNLGSSKAAMSETR